MYGDGPPGSHPLTTAPAQCASSAAALAPAPAAPTTWIRSPGRIGRASRAGARPVPIRGRVRSPTGGRFRAADPLEEQLQHGCRALALVRRPVAGPEVTPDVDAGLRRRRPRRSARPASRRSRRPGPAIPVTAPATDAPNRAAHAFGHRPSHLGADGTVRREDVRRDGQRATPSRRRSRKRPHPGSSRSSPRPP